MLEDEEPEGVSERSPAPSVSRAIAILEYVAETAPAPGLADISRALKIPKSTAHGICRALVSGRLLEARTDGAFLPGLGLLRLASRATAGGDLAELFTRTVDSEGMPKHTIQLAVLDRQSVVYLARREGSAAVPLASNTGRALPASTTAAGKSMLALLSDEEIRELYEGQALPVLTDHSHRTLEMLLGDLAETRARGYAVEHGETKPGVMCVAAAVASRSGTPLCAVSLTTFDSPAERELLDRYGQEAVRFSRLLSSAHEFFMDS